MEPQANPTDPNNPPATPGAQPNPNPTNPGSNPPTPPATPDPGEVDAMAEKLKGKTAEEIAKMYGESEKKLGEMGSEVGKARQEIERMNIILAAISRDPEREKIVKSWIKEANDPEVDPKKKDTPEVDPAVTDIRLSGEKRIISEFEKKYGIASLPPEELDKTRVKIANALWVVADPLGKYETYEQLIREIPLTKLDGLLERAYFELNKESLSEGKGPSIGVLPSSGLPEKDQITLSADEEKAADGLGVPRDKYLERKKSMLKDNKK